MSGVHVYKMCVLTATMSSDLEHNLQISLFLSFMSSKRYSGTSVLIVKGIQPNTVMQ